MSATDIANGLHVQKKISLETCLWIKYHRRKYDVYLLFLTKPMYHINP